ncbi:flippase [Candidatus Peregrinibacteria bacterium]|nr:flippase [Candidatus Peregrinibacteria bacterium]
MSTAIKILSNTGVQILGRAVSAIFSIIIVKLITTYLGAGGYGQYVTIYSYFGFFGIAADLGLFTIAVREMAKDESKMPYIIGNVLSLRTLSVVLTSILAVLVAYLIPKYHGTLIPFGVAIAAISTILFILAGTLSSVLQVHLKMGKHTVALVVGRLVSFFYMLWVVLYGFNNDPTTGFVHLMLAGVLHSAIVLGITYYYADKIAPISYRFDWAYWKEVLLKALPYGAALIFSMIYFQIDSVLLSLMKGPEEVGIYGVPMKIVEILAIVPVFFMNSVLPVFTRHLHQKSERAKEIFQYAFDFLVFSGLPFLVGAFVLAYPIVFVVSSPEFLSRLSEGFYGSDVGLRILIFAAFFAYVNAVFSFALVALNRQIDLLKINAGCALFNIIANILVIPAWGFRGAAFTSILSELFILVFTALCVRRYFAYRLSFRRACRAFISAIVMGMVIYVLREPMYGLVQNYLVLILVPFGGLVYGGMLLLTRAVTMEMIRTVRGK